MRFLARILGSHKFRLQSKKSRSEFELFFASNDKRAASRQELGSLEACAMTLFADGFLTFMILRAPTTMDVLQNRIGPWRGGERGGGLKPRGQQILCPTVNFTTRNPKSIEYQITAINFQTGIGLSSQVDGVCTCRGWHFLRMRPAKSKMPLSCLAPATTRFRLLACK